MLNYISIQMLRIATGSIGVILLIFVIIFNKEIAEKFSILTGKFGNFYTKAFASKTKALQRSIQLKSAISKNSILGKGYATLDEVLFNLDLKRNGVTPAGFFIFLCFSGFIVTVILCTLMQSLILSPIVFCFGFYASFVLLKYLGIGRFEKREMAIMDAIDIMVADIDNGVYNTIVRYQDSFPLMIRDSFITFISNINERGYDFKTAMLLLNDELGPQFDSFARKAIYYEQNATKGMEDIFSVIVDTNRQRRIIRDSNSKRFTEFRVQFIVSMLLIVGYALFSLAFDPFIVQLLFHTNIGHILLLADVTIVVFVLARLAAIKTKAL